MYVIKNLRTPLMSAPQAADGFSSLVSPSMFQFHFFSPPLPLLLLLFPFFLPISR